MSLFLFYLPFQNISQRIKRKYDIEKIAADFPVEVNVFDVIYHDGKTIFEGIENPFEATRYHSLLVQRDTLPGCLQITAETKEHEIMGLKHKDFPVWGVQFHPESILTKPGKKLLGNFLKIKT